MGKVRKAFGYAAGGLAGITLAGYFGLKHLFFGTKTRTVFTTTALAGIFLATQCDDEIKNLYNDVTGIPEMEQSIAVLEDSVQTQELKYNKLQKQKIEEAYLTEQKIDSLNQNNNQQQKEIFKLQTKNEIYEKKENQNLETLANQQEKQTYQMMEQTAKIDSLYNALDFLMKNNGTKTQKDSIYKEILELK